MNQWEGGIYSFGENFSTLLSLRPRQLPTPPLRSDPLYESEALVGVVEGARHVRESYSSDPHSVGSQAGKERKRLGVL